MSIKTPIREQLADYAHKAWACWAQRLLSKCAVIERGSMIIPAELVAEIKQKIGTHHSDLDYDDQKSDLAEADAILRILRNDPRYQLMNALMMNPTNGRNDLIIVSQPLMEPNLKQWSFEAADPIDESRWKITIKVEEL